MNNPVNIYAMVAPVVLLLVVAEFIYCIYKKNGYYSFQDSLIGLGTAILAQCVNVAVAVAVLGVYGWVYDRFAITHLQPTILNYAICYLGVDFLFYWFHRAGHRVNLLWAMHVPHHSAEELNYAVALRASFTQRAASFLFYWPLAVIGFSPAIILPVVALNLVLQFIPHTRVIPKLPSWIDSWLNTPYHHRIHHAANRIYWDKNYGGTFIFWDKLFGTFKPETEEPYYGVSIHPMSWDPTYLNFHWFHVLYKDMRAATHFSDKVLLWFKPPGFRPRNLPEYDKPPHSSAVGQIKFRTPPFPNSTPYLLAQLVISFALMSLVVGNNSLLSTFEKGVLSFLLWLGITAWGGILASKKWAIPLEAVRIPLVAGFLVFFAGQVHPIFQEHSASVFLSAGVIWLWAVFGMQTKTSKKLMLDV